jgi:DNA-binding CsgD family transcriptional regulator
MRTEFPIVVPPRPSCAPPFGPAPTPRDDPQRALVDAIENPAVLIECDGWVRTTNRAAAAMLGQRGLLAMRSGRLEPANPSGRDGWRRLLDDALRAGRADGELVADGARVPVRVVRLGAQRLVAILPTPAARRTVAADPVERVAADAGLTQSEVAVLRGLLAGASVRAIATARATSEATVRCQVRALLTKTGTSSIRQLLVTVLAPSAAGSPGQAGGIAIRC